MSTTYKQVLIDLMEWNPEQGVFLVSIRGPKTGNCLELPREAILKMVDNPTKPDYSNLAEKVLACSHGIYLDDDSCGTKDRANVLAAIEKALREGLEKG